MNVQSRHLNDYESMLATSTCNVGLKLKFSATSREAISSQDIYKAWQACVPRYKFLQFRAVPLEGHTGKLGPRYTTEPIIRGANDSSDVLFQIQEVDDDFPPSYLAGLIQNVGCSALDPQRGSYVIRGYLKKSQELVMVLSLTHALSDGPGALQVASYFLTCLEQILAGVEVADAPTQPMIDLQARILGNDYGANAIASSSDVYADLQTYTEQLRLGDKSTRVILPPECFQKIPSDSSADEGCIDCVAVSLSAEETTSLRNACRTMGGTVQGAVSAAALVARIQELALDDSDKTGGSSSIECVIQVPINARRLVDSMDPESCLCGSAGVIHSVQIPFADVKTHEMSPITLASLVKDCTERLQSAMEQRQPVEWLVRLMNNPSSLPPYSLMASSIGVSPVQKKYGSTIEVQECIFFGASLHTSSQAKGTMIHVLTFDGRLQAMLNFTSPGISRAFMQRIAERFKAFLLSIASFDTRNIMA